MEISTDSSPRSPCGRDFGWRRWRSRSTRATPECGCTGPASICAGCWIIAAFFFLAKFTEKPLRFFGLVGSLFIAAGTALSLVLFIQRVEGQGIANRPALLLAVLFLALGVQLMGLGLVGEIIVHLRAPHRRAYRVRERA